jgi:Holliday junction resolvase RusA-like endonuclease
MTARIVFEVAGHPVPQGSTRAFVRGKRAITTNDPTGRIERWRGDVRSAARAVLPPGWERLTGPVEVSATFRIARPKSHFLPVTKSRHVPVLRDDAPIWCTTAPDADKLLRAIFDALSLVVYVDDRQVALIGPTVKVWSTLPGALIIAGEIVP